MQNYQDASQSEDSDDDFGQKLPPLHVYLKRVLDKYPEGGQILKELLQNADDAGAKQVIFLHDKTQHPTKHLWTKDLDKFNGPALYVYNDATFDKPDWDNIQHPEQSGKQNDPTKVGRFGLGFISVYHLTDMPSVFSGTQVGFLDPHEKYFTLDPVTGKRKKGKRGKKWKISKDLLQPNIKDQFSPFMHDLFECNEQCFQTGEYNGTIFRFPLRQEQSKVSRTIYNDDRVNDLFQSFQNDAEISLLFLKNVETVSVYEKSNSSQPKLVFKVEVSQECRLNLQKERSKFITACRGPATSDAISQCGIDIKKSSLSTGYVWNSMDVTVNSFLIVNILKRSGLSETLQALLGDEDLKQLPWVGVAAATTEKISEGRAFCFLPLPQSERSNLPIHVHGYFGLGDNRRSIKWPDRESTHDKAAIWNRQIIEEILPDAYKVLITKAIKTGLPAEKVYQLWPNVDSLEGPWANAFQNAVSKLSEEEILYTNSDGGSWKRPAEVYFEMEDDPLIHKVMIRKHLAVVHVPSNVSEALEFGGFTLTKVTSAIIREAIRNDTLHWLTREEKMKLLEFVLKDKEFSDLTGVHLLPLRNKTFIAFSRCGSSIYLQTDAIPIDIFPNMQSRFCSDDCPRVLTDSNKAKSSTQLSSMSTSEVPTVLKENLPHEWVNGTGIIQWRRGSNQPGHMEWLQKLWTWLQRGPVSLTQLSGLPLVQIEDNGGSISLARLHTNSLIHRNHCSFGVRTQLSDSICKLFESLGAVVVRQKLPDFILHHSEISSFICSGNSEGVMCVLDTFTDANLMYHIRSGSEGLKSSLASIISELPTSIPPRWKNSIRHFPIFKSTGNTNIYISANECSSAVPIGLHGIPLPNNRLRQRFVILDSTVTGLTTKLGIRTISAHTLLEDHILPDVQARLYSEKESASIMKWVLEQTRYDDLVRDLQFLPTSNGSYSSPSEVYDPGNSLLGKLFRNKPVFPSSTYSHSILLHHLRRIGMKSEKHVTAEELLETAREIQQSGDRARSCALLLYISRYLHILSSRVRCSRRSMSLEECLSDVSWVACADTRPLSYPSRVPWYGERATLYKPTDVRPIEVAYLVGSVAPLIDIKAYPDKLHDFFGWNINVTSTCPRDQVIQHLTNLSHCDNPTHDMVTMIDSVYKFIEDAEDVDEFSSMLKDTSWVWHGSGFTTCDKVAFSSVVQPGNLKPFLYLVPPELQKYKDLMTKLGVRESFKATDFVGVLKTLKDSNGDDPLDTTEIEAVQDILKALTSLDDLESVHAQILAPDSHGVLQSPVRLTYRESVEEDFDDNELEGFMFAHRDITSYQAKKLGIRTHRDIQLDQSSTDDGFELPFGQHEQLTTRLRGILREYSHTPDVLKELLQNADDAGATEIHVVYDQREHGGSDIPDEWRSIHSLPAICVYNDKPFTDEDIEGIQNVGVGGKISDTTTTGRFGIGFNSVYHLTDCPSFLTQNKQKLCVFDPHVTHIPRATETKPGRLYTNNQSVQKIFRNMIRGYLHEFEGFDLSKGTMFRFPLRPHNMESKISEKRYDQTDVAELLAQFESVSKEALLFLNNISKISISEIHKDTGELKLRYSVVAETSQRTKDQRRELSTHLEAYKNVDITQIPHINHVYPVIIKDSKKVDEQWLVSQSIGLDGEDSSNEGVKLDTFMTKTHLPRGGVAAHLHGGDKTKARAGKAFCFLPLQIDTHLPVHVNGTFLLDQSRRNLKKGDEGMTHKWNRLLATHVIGPAYANLLVEAGPMLLKSAKNFYISDGQFQCRQYDRLFPTIIPSRQDVWKLVAISTLRYIGSRDLQVLPVIRKFKEECAQFNVTWCGTRSCSSNAFFDDLSRIDPFQPVSSFNPVTPPVTKPEKNSATLRTLLRDTGFNLISSGMNIYHSFTRKEVNVEAKVTQPVTKPEKNSAILRTFLRYTGFNLISSGMNIYNSFTCEEVNIKAEAVSPGCVLDHLRKCRRIANSFPCHVNESAFKTSKVLEVVLDYSLDGIDDVDYLEGLPFQLDNTGSLDIFHSDSSKYVSYFYDLLPPSLQNLFIHSDVVSSFRTWLSKLKAKQSNCPKAKQSDCPKDKQSDCPKRKQSDSSQGNILRDFTISELAIHIGSYLPLSWKGLTSHTSLKALGLVQQQQYKMWLIRLWDFICLSYSDENQQNDLNALSDWPIIPTTSGHLVSIGMSKTVLTEELVIGDEGGILELLLKLDCRVVNISTMLGRFSSKRGIPRDLQHILSRRSAGLKYRRDILTMTQHMINNENVNMAGKLTTLECGKLLRYFQEGCEIFSEDDFNRIKQLPIFSLACATSQGSIHEYSQCYILQDDVTVPATIFDLIGQNAHIAFLEQTSSLGPLYQHLGVDRITMPDIYLNFILPKMSDLCLRERLVHIEYIREEVLTASSTEEKQQICTVLKEIPFIEDMNGNVHTANFYFDPTNHVFSYLEGPRLIPEEFRSDEWRQFLIDVGLQCAMTKKLFLIFAITIAKRGRHADIGEAKRLTNVAEDLIGQISRSKELLNEGTLAEICQIKFVPTVRIDDIENKIHTQADIISSSESSIFICFKEAVPEQHRNLVWSVAPLIASSAVPPETQTLYNKKGEKIRELKIHKCLGIETTPKLTTVLQHMKRVCHSASKKNAFDHEDSMAKEVRQKLIAIIDTMMEYLKTNLKNNKEEIRQHMQHIPICLVGEEKDVLVRANQLVFDLDKTTEDELQPYLYRAPRHLGEYDEMLRALGAQERPSFDQLAMVLHEMHDRCEGESMNRYPNEKKTVYAAVRILFHSLLVHKDYADQITVTNVHLPTTEDRLAPSTDLYYTDLDDMDKSLLLSNEELVASIKMVMGASEFIFSNVRTDSDLIELLPSHMRPTKKTTQEKPLESNVPCIDGNQCPIIQLVKEIMNSRELQSILLRLLYHQTKLNPSLETKKMIANLRDFDNFQCVQELQTGYYDSNGGFLGKRAHSRDILLSSSSADENKFEIHIGHTDISEDTNSGAIFFHPLAQSINRICKLGLDKLHVCYLKDVLPSSSMQKKNKILESFNIPEYKHLSEGCPGSPIPRDFWCLLNEDLSNKFHEGDTVVYKQLTTENASVESFIYVYAKVLERLSVDETSDDMESVLCKYKIDVGEPEPIVVSVIQLFKFRRPEKNSNALNTDCKAITPYTQDDNPNMPINAEESETLNDLKAKIRQSVAEAMTLSESEKRECLRRLYRMWHPDKSPHHLATRAFQILVEEIEKHDRDSSSSYSQWNADIRTDSEGFERYRQGSYGGTGWAGSGASFHPHSYSFSRPDPKKARLWYKQAVEDLEAVQEQYDNGVKRSLAWPAFILHQAAEKALKAIIFQLEGSQTMSHNLNALVTDVRLHSTASQDTDNLRKAVGKLLALRCDAVRPRYPEDNSNRTTGERYKHFNTCEAITVCRDILEIASEIMNSSES